MNENTKECTPIESADTPWGKWEVLLETNECKVKRITVNPGHRLSYQKHFKRSEHWFVVKGTATVTLNDKTNDYPTGTYVDIKCEDAHRVANTSDDTLVFIEIQQGTYFGEDDIVRLEDDYNRV